MLQQRNATLARWSSVVERLKKQTAGSLVMKTGSINTPDMGRRRSSETKRGRTKVSICVFIMILVYVLNVYLHVLTHVCCLYTCILL